MVNTGFTNRGDARDTLYSSSRVRKTARAFDAEPVILVGGIPGSRRPYEMGRTSGSGEPSGWWSSSRGVGALSSFSAVRKCG